MQSIVLTFICLLVFFIFLFLWKHLEGSQEIKGGKDCYDRWKSYEEFEWLQYALVEIPKLLKQKSNIKDETQVSNFRKAVDLYIQLKEIGFVRDLENHGKLLMTHFNLKDYPFYGYEKLTLDQALLGSAFSYHITSVLKLICPCVRDSLEINEDNSVKDVEKAKKLKISILNLIKEIQDSGMEISVTALELFKESPRVIFDRIGY